MILGDKGLFLKLFIAFVASTVIGTVTHEFGHYTVARSLGYQASVHYAYTLWWQASDTVSIDRHHEFLIVLGGPVTTVLIGTMGLLFISIYKKKFLSGTCLGLPQWLILFLSLFWLRQSANLVGYLSGRRGLHSITGDEIRIAKYLGLPAGSLLTLSGLFGFMVLSFVVFKCIPLQNRMTFLIAGFTGGVSGYLFWIVYLGKFILP